MSRLKDFAGWIAVLCMLQTSCKLAFAFTASAIICRSQNVQNGGIRTGLSYCNGRFLSLNSKHPNGSEEEAEPANRYVDITSNSAILAQADVILKSKSKSKSKIFDIIANDSAKISFSKVPSRRMFVASALVTTSVAIAANDPLFPYNSVAHAATMDALQYQKSPINKRSGVTVFSAEKDGYNVRFVTYLARFLLYFDDACQRWWYSRASDLPRRATAEEVNMMRLNQFAAFSASVEVGLQEYGGPEGPQLLMDSLLKRYCPDKNSPEIIDSKENPDKAAKQAGEIKEARRQIAMLFGLMEVNQPVEKLTKLLAAIDNAEIMFVAISSRGGGYAPGYGPPEVIFPPPAAGDDYKRATGRAVLQTNGKILRLDLNNRGFGYSKPPTVSISPPSLSQTINSTQIFQQATATAIIFRNGVNKGRIERLQIDDPGSGYAQNETITIKISPPELLPNKGGVTATAIAIREYEVASIQIIDGGSGYASEKTLPIYVEPPPLTARINLNDPMVYQNFIQNESFSKSDPMKVRREKLAEMQTLVEKVAANDGVGGGGGCVGRACYDSPVIATAFPRAEFDTYSSFGSQEEVEKFLNVESALEKRSAASVTYTSTDTNRPIVSGTVGGYGLDKPPSPFLGVSSSTQLLSLLPAGIGLEYNTNLKRYQLAAGQGFEGISENWMQGSSSKPISTEFGPRGRSPIERQKELDFQTVLRFCLSGAICSSGVHLALTPIDVVKTKVQTDPVKYKGVFRSLNKVLNDEGLNTLFTGWAPTFLGYFVWGAISYSTTEAFRRFFSANVSAADAVTLEVPIILLAAGLAAFIGSFFITPFEAVRIRSVAQPDFADSITGVLSRILKEEGALSLFSAIGPILLKEIPFACAKFAVFDITSNYLYEQFPAAREDLKLSLSISLFSGILGGIVAAVASNPADATISEMKKRKSDMGPLEAANILLDREGIPALFKGLGLRMFFYSLVVSLQFFVYDYIRFALGIGSDDLKLYLDVLGGALKESGGPM